MADQIFQQPTFQTDPRAIMAQQLMAGAQQSINQPTPSPLAALAKALSMGIAGYAQGSVQKEYQGKQDAASKALTDAMATLQRPDRTIYDPGIPGADGAPDIMAPQTTIEPGGIGGALGVLAKNPDTSQFGMSQALALGLMSAKMRMERDNQLFKDGLRVDAAGTGTEPIPHFGESKGANAAAELVPQIPGKAALAGAEEGARKAGALPYVGPTAQAQAAGTAQGELPYVGPKAAAQAAGAFYGAPQKSEPGATFVQMQPGAPGAAPTGTQVYANPNPSPGTQPGHIDTFLADTFKGYEETAAKGREKIANMQQLNSMLTGVETGKFGGTTLDLLKTARAAGLTTDGMDAKTGKMEAATALGRQLALEGRNFPGAVSNYEQQLLQSMAPGLETTPQGRAQMLDMAQARQRRNEDIAKIGRDMLTDPNSGGRLSVGYLTKLEEYAKQNGLTGISSGAAPAGAPQITATGKNGERIGWNGTKWVPLQ